MSVTDRFFIREMNEKLILKTIIQENEISRADISKKTNLNKATVSSIVADLLEKDLIIETGSGESKGGRKPIMVTFHQETALSLSIDLGNSYISSMLTYLDGTVVLEKHVSSVPINKRTVMKELKNLIHYYLEHAPSSTYGIIGICIGVHGIVNNNKIIFSPFYSFEDFELVGKLEKEFDIPVTLENEANLSTLGEKHHLTNLTNLININVRTGIGAGIILNNDLFTGNNGYAGEIGHMIGVPNGKKCPCGNRGCIEQYASEQQILKLYGRKIGEKHASFSQLKEDYLEDKPEAVETIDIFIRYISIGINNIITTFNPEMIIINSKFTNEIDGIIDKVRENINFKMNDTAKITSSSLCEKSTLLGGAYVNFSNFLGVDY